MRWEELFRDLDQEWEAAAAADIQAEVADRTRAELARIGVLDRLRGSVGGQVRVHTPVGSCAGELTRVAADCLLLRDGAVEMLVTAHHISGIEGLAAGVVTDEQVGGLERRLGLASVLRRVVRDRAAVTVERAGSSMLHGTPVQAGADFVELAVHERGASPRRSAVTSRQVVPFAAIVVVRREP
ncbi:MAG TPA: hypothetical protein VFJ14_02695 [Nocardioidaceae bacterium]|nr:hypothetical protein [Nocardioidaceae bacterium]